VRGLDGIRWLGREKARRAAVACAVGVVALLSGCASSRIRTAFEPQARWTDRWLAKVERFVVVVDASGSMNEPWRRERKVDLATRFARSLNDSLPARSYVSGLRAYGRGRCVGGDATELLVGMSPHDHDAFEAALDRIACAGGASHLDRALEGVAGDLQGLTTRSAVIVVTDGVDLGDGAVAAAQALKAQFGDGVCIWGVLIGESRNGVASLGRVVEAGGCGGLVSALELRRRADLAAFVERVFLGVDDDGDAVANELDRCPSSDPAIPVQKDGCPLDTDRDGVIEPRDRCPGTPPGVRVDGNGCPVDSDLDGVPDFKDRCGRTPRGAKVDGHGCPLDEDGDGVADHLDRCAKTPKGTPVDASGCPLDSDGDGVPDTQDRCPDTPAGTVVGWGGCPADADADGVVDERDACPGTPAGAPVDATGCPRPEVTVRGEEWSVEGAVLFDLDRAELKPAALPILDHLAGFLARNPDYQVVVEGHTDSSGTLDHNIKLSERRAEAVRDYLVRAGVGEARLSTNAVGPADPVAPNDTADNRARNRRVEFRPSRVAVGPTRLPPTD
jgi:outer membrane protein OmpA-like peptidoglycan-associated protein